MDENQNFAEKVKKYSLSELEDIKDRIDSYNFPERYKLVLDEIASRKALGERSNNNFQYAPVHTTGRINKTTRSSNPALRSNTFRDLPLSGSGVMSIQGVVNKSGFLITLVVVSAAYIWTRYFNYGMLDPEILPAAFVCTILGLITALVTVFKKTWAAFTAPVYAVLEGVFLGVISSFFEQRYPGIVIQAVGLTFGTFAALLAAYTTRLIKPSENFKLGVVAATGGIAIFYLIAMVLGFFDIEMPLIHETGLLGIGFSIFVVIIAALNLVLDFDFIEQGVGQGAPKYMEWYSAFGLLVTLVWLYLEILKLLSKLRSK